MIFREETTMKIKVAALDHDIEFMDRLAKIFQQKYADGVTAWIWQKL